MWIRERSCIDSFFAATRRPLRRSWRCIATVSSCSSIALCGTSMPPRTFPSTALCMSCCTRSTITSKPRSRPICICSGAAVRSTVCVIGGRTPSCRRRAVVCDRDVIDLRDAQKRAVHEAIVSLPQDMQTAVYLIYFEELSYADAAFVMRKKPKQVDNLLYRAKGMLREVLGGVV